tara:strand:- start:565089 stop:569420 length:4332 start_codon:yes stop_codon:yes gene_type:complete
MTRKLFLVALLLLSFKVVASIPVLSNFRIENTNTNRVYFDSNEPITASTYGGFIISGKSINGITIADGQTTGHYFSVSSSFNFWDNNTIRYSSGSNLKSASGFDLPPFTLEYIKNNIPEPEANLNTYYVATNGSDSNNGLTEATPFKTIQKGLNVAKAGSTVYVKAGRYVNRSLTSVKNSGTVTSPVKLIGYKTNPGDINSMYYSFTQGAVAPDLDASEMPLLDGENSNSYGLHINGPNYIIIRNIQVTRYLFGFNHWNGIGYILDNCIAKDFYGTGSQEGGAVNTNPNTSNKLYSPSYFRIKNTIAINGGMANLHIRGSHNLVDNVKTYCDKAIGSGTFGSDYFIAITGDNNIIRNSSVEALNNNVNAYSHGFSARGASHDDGNWGSTTSYNLFQHLYVKSGSQEALQSRNPRTDYNVWKDIVIEGFGQGSLDGEGISNQTGAQNNTYDRITLRNLRTAFMFTTGSEGNNTPSLLHTSGNVLKNIIVDKVHTVIGTHTLRGYLGTYENNKIYNVTINNASYLFDKRNHTASNFAASGNEIINSIFNGVARERRKEEYPFTQDMFKIGYSNFYGGFTKLSWATNSISVNPNLDNDLMFTSETPSSIYDGGTDVQGVNFDIDGTERTNGKYSMGAYEDLIPRVGNVSPNVIICEGESTTLVASGGTSYEWNTGETSASISVSPTETGVYTVVIGDGNNTDTHTIEVTVNESPSVDLGEDITICAGEEITLTATGVGDFLWSTGETTASIQVSPSSTITYTVTASNTCNSEAVDEIVITVNETPTVELGEDVVICDGEFATLTAIGDGPFEWSTGETTSSIVVTPTSTTIYTVTSSNGICSTTDEIEVVVNELATVDLGADVIICQGELITLTATGIGDFLWSTGETTTSIEVSPLSTTVYTVTASNACNAEVTDEIIVTVNETPTVDLGEDIVICEGELTTLTAIGSGPFQWSTGETTASIEVTPTSTTTYTIISSNGSCSATDEILVTVNELPTVNLGEDIIICQGETVTLMATGIGPFEWSTGETTTSIDVNPSSTTTYSVTARNACSTSATDEITVTVVPNVSVNAGPDVTVCNGEKVTLVATGSGPFEWSTGESTASIEVTPTSTTIYAVTTSNGSCAKTDYVKVTVNAPPTVSAGSDVSICDGERITLTATGNGSYLWSTGETSRSISVNPNATTTYTVTTSAEGCTSTAVDAVVVTVNEKPSVRASEDVTVEVGESVTLTATGVGAFVWNTGEVGSSITVSPYATTVYTVKATTGGGCSSSDKVVVTVVDSSGSGVVNAYAGEDVSICSGKTIVLTASGGDSYLWSTGETNRTITVKPQETIIYSVKVFNGENSATDHVTVFIDEKCEISVEKEMVVYPNPTQGYNLLNIEMKGFKGESNISLFNLKGVLMYSDNVNNEDNIGAFKKQVNLSRFSNGIYLVRVDNYGSVITKKVIVSN